MKYFEKIARYNVALVEEQLDAQPDLWDERHFRTTRGGPFEGTSDIWVRYRDPAELTSPKAFGEPHFAIWYPAWHRLAALKPIVLDLSARVGSVHLGGILITRIPAGGQVRPHHDRGSWHAEFYNRKIYVPIRTNDRCVNICEDERVVMKAGDAWWFNNLVTHSVVNEGETDRMTLIVCLCTG